MSTSAMPSPDALAAPLPAVTWRSLAARDWFLVTLVTAALVVLFTNCEHFQANNGLGADGYTYAVMARDFENMVFKERIDSYFLQRISIPAALHYSSRWLHYELTDKTILRLWRALDLVCLGLIAWLWCGIVRVLGISLRGKWLGALFFFVNFAVLKWSSYYPNITDIPAYALGTAMLYCYLRNRSLALGLVTLLGAFTWPTALYFGLVLLLFPRGRAEETSSRGAPWYLHVPLALAAGTIIYLRLQFYHHRGGFYLGNETRASETYLNLGIAISALYVFLSFLFLLNSYNLFNIRYFLRLPTRLSFWVGLATYAAVYLIVRQLHPRPTALTTMLIIKHILWSSVLSPGIFLVGLAIFFGPVMVLAALRWKAVCAQVHRYGVGLTLVLLLAIPLGLAGETRRVINLVPFLIPFVVAALEPLPWGRMHYWFLAGLSLVASKVWMIFNPAFDWNLIVMNIGPWMSYASYSVHGAITLFIGYILYTFTLVDQPGRTDFQSVR